MIQVDHPKLWSAEHPNLYNLSIDLKDESGNVTEHITKRIGIREVSIKDGVLLVNNMPVKLAGMCRHEHWATLGCKLGARSMKRKDIELMKAANINAIRTSHYPYGSGFYDLCDEMGMYVADEMAGCWVRTNTDDLTPAFQQHAREFVERDKNHPSVIIWAIGNENQPGKNNKIAAQEIRKIDPTRPRLVSIQPASNADVELDDQHYVLPSQIAKDQADPRPKNGADDLSRESECLGRPQWLRFWRVMTSGPFHAEGNAGDLQGQKYSRDFPLGMAGPRHRRQVRHEALQLLSEDRNQPREGEGPGRCVPQSAARALFPEDGLFARAAEHEAGSVREHRHHFRAQLLFVHQFLRAENHLGTPRR